MKRKKNHIVTSIADKMDVIRPTNEEGAEIRALDKNVASILVALGNHEVMYLNRKSSLIQALDRAQQSLNERAMAVAEAHAIEQDKWTLDIPSMTFKKKVG